MNRELMVVSLTVDMREFWLGHGLGSPLHDPMARMLQVRAGEMVMRLLMAPQTERAEEWRTRVLGPTEPRRPR